MGVKLGQKWAVKDGNLLASNQVGSRFFNKEFDFSRASNGTYVDRDGLLKTAELYNLLSYSNTFSDSSWLKADTSVTSGQIGYDGSSNAWLLEIIGSTGFQTIRKQPISFSGVNTFSLYFKSGTLNWTRIRTDVSNTYFDLENGLVGAEDTSLGASIESVGNGWYRCIVPISGSSSTLYIYPASGNGNVSQSSGSIYIQDAQLVEGTEPLDYQYTNGLQGLPRIDFSDGVGALLLEPQRTNIVTYSEDFSQWDTINLYETLESLTAPDGSSTVYLLKDDAFNNYHLIYFNTNSVSANWTFSCFVKKKDDDIYIQLRPTGLGRDIVYATFNPEDGSLLDSGGTNLVSTFSEDYGNGWYRVGITCSEPLLVDDGVGIAISNSPTEELPSYIGNGSGFYVWGAQLEVGSYATSYIKSDSGTTTTRLADVCNNSGSAQDFNSEEGVLYAEVAALANDGTQRYIAMISDNSFTEAVVIRYSTIANTIDVIIRDNGANAYLSSFLLDDATNFNKIAFKYKSGNIDVYVNGVKILNSSNTFLLNGLRKLDLSYYQTGLFLRGKVRNLQVFTEALSDAELISLTT